MYRIPECIEYQTAQNTRAYIVTEYIEYQRNQSETVDSSKWYHKVISEESNTKPDMEETRVPGGNKPLTEFK